MKFYSRKWIKPDNLNSNGTIFGGSVLSWVDEEAAIFTACQLNTSQIVTKYMSEINFVNTARQGDILEIGMEPVKFGRTSITIRCEVRNKFTKAPIVTIERIVFVNVDENGRSKPHGITHTPELEEAQKSRAQEASAS